jgi:hypothetical protein
MPGKKGRHATLRRWRLSKFTLWLSQETVPQSVHGDGDSIIQL